jgi:hypothetical protein
MRSDFDTLVERADALAAKGTNDWTPADFDESVAIFRKANATLAANKAALDKADRAAAVKALKQLGSPPDYAAADFGAALAQAGWRRGGPGVAVPYSAALGIETKAGSIDGGTNLEDVVGHTFAAPDLGVDGRYIFPSLRTEGVAADATGVVSYRQKSRTLASGSDMVRSITAVSDKPETSTVAEVVTAELKQIATISSGTPNVLLANEGFRSWVNGDLRTAYRAALDYHVVERIVAANIAVGGGGANDFEAILYAQEAVRAAGYDPNTVVMSPADALAVQLLQLTGGDSYAFAQTPPRIVITPAVGDGEGFVFDRGALGILFLSPVSVQAFEENAGATNSSTVRAESNGLFLVQREDAAAYLSASS